MPHTFCSGKASMGELATSSAGQLVRGLDKSEGANGSPRWLSLLFVSFGLVFIALATPYADLVLNSRLTEAHLSSAALTQLLLLVLARTLLSRWGRTWSWGEVLLVYGVWHFCAALPSSGLVGFLFPLMAAFHYFTSPANQWQELFGSYLPSWFVVSDKAAVQGFYHGIPAPSPLPWQPWLAPTLFWVLFASCYLAAHFCLALWLHRRWIVEEKLAFPTVQVVQAIQTLELKNFAAPFLLGLGIPLFVHSLNALSRTLPALPSVPLQFRWGQVFTDFPFDIWQGEETTLRFAAVGMGYLIPSEVAVSFWGFYWVHMFVKLGLRWYGVPPGVGTGGITTLQRAQEAGAFLVLAAALLTPSFRQTLSNWRSADQTSRWGLVGWLFGLLALVGLLAISGMQPIFATLLLVVWTSVHLGLTRIVSAGGVMHVECSFTPWDVLARTFGVQRVGWRNLTVMAFPQQLLMFDQVTIPLPYLMDGFKLATAVPFSVKRFALHLGWGYLVTLAVALPFSFWLCYRRGALNLTPWFTQQEPAWAFHRLRSWVAAPFGTDVPFVQNMIIGGTAMAILLYLHRHFLWWQISPLGLIMSSTATLRNQWFSLFLGWLTHRLTLRLMGLKGYQALRPLFVGIVWGELVAHGLWTVVEALRRR